jgi:hypothetical protein
MRAVKVFERLDFQRGQDPKKSMRIGKYRSLILNAFFDPGNYVDSPEGFDQWMKENPLLSEKLEYKTNPTPVENYYIFDLDAYSEEKKIDREEIEEEFIPLYSYPPVKPGEVRVKIGTSSDIPGSKILYYSGGSVDGFISRKDWLKLE